MDRYSKIDRSTKETNIALSLKLDGSGLYQIDTGIGYLNHMLEQFAFHSLFDLTVKCEGDLEIDGHHTTEDIAIALGSSFLQALGDKKGICRYAHSYIPMDEALLRTVVDVSGRPDFYFHGTFTQPKIGALNTQLIPHFFKSFAMNSHITLHMEILYGENDHHKCEGLFKSLARALRAAVAFDTQKDRISSTKGTL